MDPASLSPSPSSAPAAVQIQPAVPSPSPSRVPPMEPQQQKQKQKKKKQVAPVKKRVVKQMPKTGVDHHNVVLALPALSAAEIKKIELRAERKKRMLATDENNAGGPSRKNKKREAATEPKDAPTTGRPCASGKKRVTTAENTTCASSTKNKNREAPRAPKGSPMKGRAHASRNKKVAIGENNSGGPSIQQPNVSNNEQQIVEEQAGVENQDVAVNQQHLQAGIMHEQNIQNAIEENVPEDPIVSGDIFNFPLNNELIDLPKIEDILEDPTGAENEQNIINNQQHIPEQQAGIVHQQNPAENARVEVDAEVDRTVFGDIFDFPLNNQLMDLD